jgi:2-amino-4-hydroxy-6-hydroxymethyldihydropteridine diphosphokinase
MNDHVYIGLGSNLGDREQFMVKALDALRGIDDVALLDVSSLYESAPVGPAQPRYLNGVVKIACGLAPQRLLGILKHIEGELGRKRGDRWGPRQIDLDILLWGNQVIADANLQVPHLELHKRRFALEPLCELNPEAHHPVLGKPVSKLLNELARQDVVRAEATCWPEAAGFEE